LEPENKQLSLRKQCELLGVNRSSWYYRPKPQDKEKALYEKRLMDLIDKQFTRMPFYGVPRMTAHLKRLGYPVGPDRVRTLMRRMGLEAIYPRPKTSRKHPEHKIYSYLLKGVEITRPNQVWAADITYIRLMKGFAYLVAIMDWFSRYVLAWRLSNTLEADFCIECLEHALIYGVPEIFTSYSTVGLPSAWTDGAGCLTTFLWSAYGAASSTKTFIYKDIKSFRRRKRGWDNILHCIIASGSMNP